MTRQLILILIIAIWSVLLCGQSGDTYSFIVAGHAYGAHAGTNLGLHPPLLNSLDAGYDSTATMIFFTGDIVNTSTAESWQQVENELSAYAPVPYYSMGNHDDNDVGHAEFIEKFGALYYAFYFRTDLFIVLNSTESDRSISPVQMEFLNDQLNGAGDTTHNVFIFFHEIIWNSHEKYIGVRSNSRSRYDQILGHSNYWEEVHPMLLDHPDKKFYLFGGDVGGNTDAVAAFYDQWDNVTLLASGMGEVPDENYMLVKVKEDSVSFSLVPLNTSLTLPDIMYFSVPPAPDTIIGPDEVYRGSSGIEYSVPEIPFATAYYWNLPDGLSGINDMNNITVDVDSAFTGGTISVYAERDGFGRGPAIEKPVTGLDPSVGLQEITAGAESWQFVIEPDEIIFRSDLPAGEAIIVRIFDPAGRMIKTEKAHPSNRDFEWRINRQELPEGIILVTVTAKEGVATHYFMNVR